MNFESYSFGDFLSHLTANEHQDLNQANIMFQMLIFICNVITIILIQFEQHF